MSKRKLATFLLVLLTAATAVAQKYATVSYRKAKDHVGEIVWVEGKVLRTQTKGEGVYLIFSGDPKYVRILVPKQYLGNFEGGLKHLYVGSRIKAIGKVEQMGSKLVLGVNEPQRIVVVGNESPSS